MDDPKPGPCTTSAPDLVTHISPAVVLIAATTINLYQVQERVIHIASSGFLFDRAGLIFTNAHVAYGFQLIRITLAHGTTVTAQLIGAVLLFDLAVLRIPPPLRGEFPSVALGHSDQLRVGKDVLAIGNPLGLDRSVTRGIVSRLDRLLPRSSVPSVGRCLLRVTGITAGPTGILTLSDWRFATIIG